MFVVMDDGERRSTTADDTHTHTLTHRMRTTDSTALQHFITSPRLKKKLPTLCPMPRPAALGFTALPVTMEWRIPHTLQAMAVLSSWSRRGSSMIGLLISGKEQRPQEASMSCTPPLCRICVCCVVGWLPRRWVDVGRTTTTPPRKAGEVMVAATSAHQDEEAVLEVGGVGGAAQDERRLRVLLRRQRVDVFPALCWE